jgi:hypothetical protein
MQAAKKYYVKMEALVWNSRLRMERRVGAAGNGMGLLNSQTTRQDSKLPRREEGWT